MDASSAVKQAGETAESYFLYAIYSIDEEFGDGYAEKNPKLIAAFIKACVMDFNTWAITEKDTNK